MTELELEQLLQLPIELKDKILASDEPHELYAASRLLFRDGKLAESEEKIRKFLAVADESQVLYAHGQFHLGSIFLARGQVSNPETAEVLKKFDELVEEHYEPSLLALSEGRKATLAFYHCDLPRAQSHWEQALRYYESAGHTSSNGLGLTYVNLGLLHRDLSGYKSAIEYLQQGIAIAKQRNNQQMLKKAYRELFFCYFWQNDAREARALYGIIENLADNPLNQIENKICRAYTLLLNKDFRGARRLLLEATAESRRLNLSKDRFETYYHLAVAYMYAGEFSRAARLMRSCQDSILRLNIQKLEARLTGAASSAQQVLVDSAKFTIQSGVGKAVNLSGKPLMKKFLSVIAQGALPMNKEQLLKEVFGFNHYDGGIHDIKVYKLVSAMNKLVKNRDWIVADKGVYRLNEVYQTEFLQAQLVPAELGQKLVVTDLLEEQAGRGLKKVASLSGFGSDLTKKIVASLETEGQVLSSGSRRWRQHQVK